MMTINNPIDIDRQQVLTRIGYADDYRPSARILSLVDDYVENYHDLLAPSYTYVIKDVISVEGNRVVIDDNIRFESRVIARLLAKCSQVAVFAATIGNHLEEMVAYLAENRLMLQATVLDAVASGAAERMAVYVEDKVRTLASFEGLRASRRFSPGYCDWKITQQKMVFQALGADTAGIKLTERFLMIPQKSVSGIIGLSRKNVDTFNPCQTCRKKDCPGRRENFKA